MLTLLPRRGMTGGRPVGAAVLAAAVLSLFAPACSLTLDLAHRPDGARTGDAGGGDGSVTDVPDVPDDELTLDTGAMDADVPGARDVVDARDGNLTDVPPVDVPSVDVPVSCVAPERFCADAGHCVNVQTDVMNCGACGRVCPSAANATASCVAGICGFVCARGFADCNMRASDACETSLGTAENCGACGRVCATGLACVAGAGGATCVPTCPMGTTRCGSSCVDLRLDPTNCGACGVACFGRPNAPPACASGGCTLTCLPGFGNCDSMEINGCETNLSTTVAHCGGCGRACPTGLACMRGSCVCPGTTTSCGGRCTDLNLDPLNCGSCGTSCSGGACVGGLCVAACVAGEIRCGGTCVNARMDPMNCGTCGNRCASMTCVAGMCSAVTCGGPGLPCCSGGFCAAPAICMSGMCR